ncbi:MAG: hypothetical protein SP4CHLAM5_11780 [Chlamydiia bacterium]|nr:hypothetical protein [Chlamydiia bacterium]MCH9619033.1 hypothetical protein [Chlamydiia bacterium]
MKINHNYGIIKVRNNTIVTPYDLIIRFIRNVTKSKELYMSQLEGNLDTVKNASLSTTASTLSVSTGDTKPSKKAKKVIMSELERLMSLLEEVQDAKSGNTSDVVNLLKKIAQGKASADDKLSAFQALEAQSKKDGGNIASLISIIQESLKDAPGAKEARAHVKTAKENLKKVTDAVANGETSFDEILDDENMKTFMSGLTGAAKPSTSTPEDSGNDHKENMLNFAVGLQSLLSDIYKVQIDQGNMYATALKAQISSMYKTTVQKNKDLMAQMAAQSKASNTKPWYMYLIAGVVAAVGAVVAFFTAGAAVAAVGLVIALIMMTPIGDKLTSALTKAFEGNNPNPTDAQKTGAQIGATAVITLITTLLSMGGSSITSVTEGATEGVEAGVESGASEASSSVSNSVVEESSSFAMEMTDMSASASGEVSEDALEGSTEELASDIENTIEENSGDDNSTEETKKSSTKGKRKIIFDKKALTTGLSRRFIGTYIQGFLASGGLLEGAELIGQQIPGGKEWMDSEVGSIVMAVGAVIVSVGMSIGTAKLCTNIGMEQRQDYIDYNGMEDSPYKLTKGWTLALNGLSLLAASGYAAAGLATNAQWDKAADATTVLAAIEATLVSLTGVKDDMTAQRDSMNKAYTKDASNVSDSIKEVLDAVGSYEAKLARQISG